MSQEGLDPAGYTCDKCYCNPCKCPPESKTPRRFPKLSIEQLEDIVEQAGRVHEPLQEVAGIKCLPCQMSGFLKSKFETKEIENESLRRENKYTKDSLTFAGWKAAKQSIDDFLLDQNGQIETLHQQLMTLQQELNEALEHQEVLFHTCAGKDCKNKYCQLKQQNTTLQLREGKMRETLKEVFDYLGKQIEAKTLNQSSDDGTQKLSRNIAELLDSTPPDNKVFQKLREVKETITTTKKDYDHPWPVEDFNTMEHRNKIHTLLTVSESNLSSLGVK